MPNLDDEAKAGTKTRKRSLAEALEIKAAALRIIEAKGTLMRVSEIDLLHAEWKGLDIMYAPKVPDDPPDLIEQAQRSGIAIPPITPHLLDILQGRKVFSIRWNDAGLVEVARFQRGEWESLLKARAMAAHRAASTGSTRSPSPTRLRCGRWGWRIEAR